MVETVVKQKDLDDPHTDRIVTSKEVKSTKVADARGKRKSKTISNKPKNSSDGMSDTGITAKEEKNANSQGESTERQSWTRASIAFVDNIVGSVAGVMGLLKPEPDQTLITSIVPKKVPKQRAQSLSSGHRRTKTDRKSSSPKPKTKVGSDKLKERETDSDSHLKESNSKPRKVRSRMNSKTPKDVVNRQKLRQKKCQTESKLKEAIKEMVKADTITKRSRNQKQIGSGIFDSDLGKENDLQIKGSQFHKFDRECNSLVTDNACVPYPKCECNALENGNCKSCHMQISTRTKTLCFCFCSYAKGTDGITYHTLCRCCGPTTNFST